MCVYYYLRCHKLVPKCFYTHACKEYFVRMLEDIGDVTVFPCVSREHYLVWWINSGTNVKLYRRLLSFVFCLYVRVSEQLFSIFLESVHNFLFVHFSNISASIYCTCFILNCTSEYCYQQSLVFQFLFLLSNIPETSHLIHTSFQARYYYIFTIIFISAS